VAGRPGLVRELGQRHGAVVTLERRVGLGQDDVDRVAQQLVALQARRQVARLVLPLVGEHDVDVAERERRDRLLRLGLDELAAQARRVAGERLDRRDRELEHHRLEAGHARPAGDCAGRGGQVGLGERGALQQRVGVLDERERRVGEAHPAPGALEQRHARLALEDRELLGDRGGRELQRICDRGDRAARGELAQQADAAEVEHSKGTLTDVVEESEWMLKAPAGTMPGP
jgi:hypothetical protein